MPRVYFLKDPLHPNGGITINCKRENDNSIGGEKMRCPYRKITYHHPAKTYKDVPHDKEEFAECYKDDCPYYYKGYCARALKEGGAE